MSGARMDVVRGQAILAGVWFVATGLAFALMLVETMGPRAPLPAADAWEWFLPLVVPTLSLMLGTIVFQARKPPKRATVGRAAFTAAVSLSLVYLVLVIVILGVWPILRLRPDEVASLLDKSKLWLPAVQSLVGIALGAFFVSSQGAGD